MPVVTITDYDRSHPQHPFSRQCPNIRLPWADMASSYQVLSATGSTRLRRIVFILLQILQVAYIALPSKTPQSLSDIPWTLASVLFFFFVAWNLHLIVNMEGERIVFGKRFGREHFDGFLWGLVPCYAVLVICEASVQLRSHLGRRGVGTAWVMLDLGIFLVAWVSTWGPYSVVSLSGDERV